MSQQMLFANFSPLKIKIKPFYLGILLVCLMDKLDGFAFEQEHIFLGALKHQWHIDRNKTKMFFAWLEKHGGIVVNVCALGFKHQFSTIPILLVYSPKQRIFTVRIRPTQFVKAKQVEFLIKHGARGDTKGTFNNAGV